MLFVFGILGFNFGIKMLSILFIECKMVIIDIYLMLGILIFDDNFIILFFENRFLNEMLNCCLFFEVDR